MTINLSNYFDSFSLTRFYKRVLFNPGKGLQSQELTGLQHILQNELDVVVGGLYPNGSLITGGVASINNGSISFTAGTAWADSFSHVVAATTFALAANETVVFGLDIHEAIATSVTDPTLLDPAIGTDNYNLPGADRFTITAAWQRASAVPAGDLFYPIYQVTNGTTVTLIDRTTIPLMDGVASPGAITRMTRPDHVHPTDTSRAPTKSPSFTGGAIVNGPGSGANAVTLRVTDTTNANGAGILLGGNGNTTPNKFLRAFNGIFQVLNNAYSAPIFSVDDAGNTAASGSVVSTNADSYGMNFRMSAGQYNTGWLNTGLNTYLLLTNAGGQTFNNFRPFTINNGNGQVAIDGTGAGVTFGPGVVNFAGPVVVQQSLNVGGSITCGPGGSFVAALQGNGYQKLPSGLIIQWGKGNTTTGNLDQFAFPIAFPNGLFSLAVTEGHAAGWGTFPNPSIYGGSVNSVNALDTFLVSAAVVTHNGTTAFAANVGFTFIAIGY